MQMWPVEANYFGDEPERSTDPSFPLLDMMAQRAFTRNAPQFHRVVERFS